MCMKCYKLNEHQTKHCKSTTVICSDCSEVGHNWTDCKTTAKRCLNCDGGHKTTAPQCPKRKEEANKIRKQDTQKKNTGLSYSSVVKSTLPPIQNLNIPSDSALKILTAIIHAHTINAANAGTYNTALNQMLTANNLPNMIFPDDPPSSKFLNNQLQHAAASAAQEETTVTQPIIQPNNNQESTKEQSPPLKRKKRDPRENTSTNLGIKIYIDPRISYNTPKTATRKLPINKFLFTYTTKEYGGDDLLDLLNSNRILIKPEDIQTPDIVNYKKLESWATNQGVQY